MVFIYLTVCLFVMQRCGVHDSTLVHEPFWLLALHREGACVKIQYSLRRRATIR